MDSNVLDEQIKKLREEVSNASLPPQLLEKVNTMIELLAATSKSGDSFVNFEAISNYINWVSSYPWNKETKDILDLNHSKEILDKNHYGLQSVKDRILEYLASIILILQKSQSDSIIRAPILCLIGLVGTGKTTLAYSIAEALGRSFQRIPFGGMGDVRALRGQSRAFADAEPGLIVKKIITAKSKNPVILLDELDRVTDSGRADIMGALVELLDPEQNSAFTDHFIDYQIDLSHVLFIATANNSTNISTAVLDRLEVIQMPSYSDEEKLQIAKKYLFPKTLSQTGLSVSNIEISDDVWPTVIRPLGYDSGIRSLERSIEGICRKVARIIVEGKMPPSGKISINPQNVKEFLPQ